jgi:hypothetical protein
MHGCSTSISRRSMVGPSFCPLAGCYGDVLMLGRVSGRMGTIIVTSSIMKGYEPRRRSTAIRTGSRMVLLVGACYWQL